MKNLNCPVRQKRKRMLYILRLLAKREHSAPVPLPQDVNREFYNNKEYWRLLSPKGKTMLLKLERLLGQNEPEKF